VNWIQRLQQRFLARLYCERGHDWRPVVAGFPYLRCANCDARTAFPT